MQSIFGSKTLSSRHGTVIAMAHVCNVDQIGDGEARRFDIEGHRIAVIRIGETVHAIGVRCSHANYSLSDGVSETLLQIQPTNWVARRFSSIAAGAGLRGADH